MTAESGVKPPEPPVVELVHPSYQPSKAELEEDLRVDATFEEAVQALAKPVRIRYIKRPRKFTELIALNGLKSRTWGA